MTMSGAPAPPGCMLDRMESGRLASKFFSRPPYCLPSMREKSHLKLIRNNVNLYQQSSSSSGGLTLWIGGTQQADLTGMRRTKPPPGLYPLQPGESRLRAGCIRRAMVQLLSLCEDGIFPERMGEEVGQDAITRNAMDRCRIVAASPLTRQIPLTPGVSAPPHTPHQNSPQG